MGTIITVTDVGGKLAAIKKDLGIDAKMLRRGIRKGLRQASLHVIRRTKRDYLSGPEKDMGRSSRGFSGKAGHQLSRSGGAPSLSASMTHKIDPVGMVAKIGWFRSRYAHVVAEPPAGKKTTTIKPQKGRFLFFPLSKRARNAWHMKAANPKSFTQKDGKKGIVIGNRRLFSGKDYAFARKVTIRARRPASRALYMERNNIAKIIVNAIRVLGRTEKI